MNQSRMATAKARVASIAESARAVAPALIANGLPPRKVADVAWAVATRLVELADKTLTEELSPSRSAQVEAQAKRDNLKLDLGEDGP